MHINTAYCTSSIANSVKLGRCNVRGWKHCKSTNIYTHSPKDQPPPQSRSSLPSRLLCKLERVSWHCKPSSHLAGRSGRIYCCGPIELLSLRLKWTLTLLSYQLYMWHPDIACMPEIDNIAPSTLHHLQFASSPLFFDNIMSTMSLDDEYGTLDSWQIIFRIYNNNIFHTVVSFENRK